MANKKSNVLKSNSYWDNIDGVEDYFKEVMSIILYIEESNKIKKILIYVVQIK